MATGQDFFTVDTLGTIAVASAAIIAVTNTLRRTLGLGGAIVPFIISLIITFGTAKMAHKLGDWPEWAIAFFNACLLYCTATGAQETVIPRPAGTTEEQSFGRRRRPWFSSWIRD
jgi:hypothetical protein